MATITLTEDTLISSLMPSGGGALASGDTIQLAGNSLIVDADAADYPVTIANGGADANLELRDLGRIKLNATLPATVHPYIDPAHPLPVSAEPGIDGDPYRTPLTANARAEIQLNGNFGLGGGAASLPTENRDGDLAFSMSTDGTAFSVESGVVLHVGDMVGLLNNYQNGLSVVSAFDPQFGTGTFQSNQFYQTGSDTAVVCAGGVVLNRLGTGGGTFISAPMSCGSLSILGNKNTGSAWEDMMVVISGASISCTRLFIKARIARGGDNCTLIGANARLEAEHLFCNNIYGNGTTNYPLSVVSSSNEVVAGEFVNYAGGSSGGYFPRTVIHARESKRFRLFPLNKCQADIFVENAIIVDATQPISKTNRLHFDNCSIGGINSGDLYALGAGTVRGLNGAWYHAPATAADVTWRYADRTIAPGATLRLRCAWMPEGSAATRASVAVTDTATWWPQLWTIGADAFASVEFTGGTADWRSELLSWRNTSTEAVQVRVWECVTGTTAGGYLKVEEVKGGAL